MPDLIRFGVSVEKKLIKKFDKLIEKEKYTNRSEALRDLIREKLVREEWKGSNKVAGVITLVYDHHHRELLSVLTDLQHDYQNIIISSQHVHLDHNNCLEIIIVKGDRGQIQELANGLRATKGVKYGQLSLATTGKEI